MKINCSPQKQLLAVLLVANAAFATSATTQASARPLAEIRTVLVGDAGNADESNWGGVAYSFRIGRFEVAAEEYCAFLNAVAKRDAYGLFDTSMQTAASVATISQGAVAYLPVTAYGEFAEGFPDRTNAAFLSVVESFELLPVTRAVADKYADVARVLRTKGKSIGSNDLWIAATALERDMALVTRNTAEFSRVPGLKIKGY